MKNLVANQPITKYQHYDEEKSVKLLLNKCILFFKQN